MKRSLAYEHKVHGTKRDNPRWSWLGIGKALVLAHLWFDHISEDGNVGLVYSPRWHTPSHPAHQEVRRALAALAAGSHTCKVLLLQARDPQAHSRRVKYIHSISLNVILTQEANGDVYARRAYGQPFPICPT
jgi:GAF domain-containing protein